MKILSKKNIFRIICLMLLVIIMANTLVPITSYASGLIYNPVIDGIGKKNSDDDDSLFGGKLFKPISKLLVGISDGILMGLQDMFMGYKPISDSIELGDVEVKNYNILYGPKTIFSNKVPALNANFINPPEGTYQVDVAVVDDEDNPEPIEQGEILNGLIDTNPNATKEINWYKKTLEEKGTLADYGYKADNVIEVDTTDSNLKKFLRAFEGVTKVFAKGFRWDYDKDNDGTKETYYLIFNRTVLRGNTRCTIAFCILETF